MRTLIWGKTFLRAFRRTVKKYPDLEKDIEETLRFLTEDPFATRLATHKLKGKLSGSWESASGQEDNILLIEIGTHDEVY